MHYLSGAEGEIRTHGVEIPTYKIGAIGLYATSAIFIFIIYTGLLINLQYFILGRGAHTRNRTLVNRSSADCTTIVLYAHILFYQTKHDTKFPRDTAIRCSSLGL